MAGMPTSQRDQLMVVAGVVAILGAVAFFFLRYGPEELKLMGTRAHIVLLDESNQRAKEFIASGSVVQIEEESKRLEENLDLMRTLIPAGTEVPALLDQIFGAARRTGLAFSSFSPAAIVQGETFDTYRFRMSMEGSYHQIGELLTAIGSLGRIIVPLNVALSASTATAAKVTRPEEQILSASFDIQTYVIRPAPLEDR